MIKKIGRIILAIILAVLMINNVVAVAASR